MTFVRGGLIRGGYVSFPSAWMRIPSASGVARRCARRPGPARPTHRLSGSSASSGSTRESTRCCAPCLSSGAKMPQAWLVIAGARAVFAHRDRPDDRFLARGLPPRPSLPSPATASRRRRRQRLYAALDVFADPSGYESFGMAFLEAWAAGKPVVGCPERCRPVRRGAGPDRPASTVPGRDPAGRRSPGAPPEPRVGEVHGEKGRQRVRDGMTWDRVAGRFRDILIEAVGRRDEAHSP